jgi:hypothetical protein
MDHFMGFSHCILIAVSEQKWYMIKWLSLEMFEIIA